MNRLDVKGIVRRLTPDILEAENLRIFRGPNPATPAFNLAVLLFS